MATGDGVREMVCVEVAGRPAPKGSRTAAKTRHGKLYTYPASKHERPWVDAVADATMVVMRHRATPAPPYHVGLTLRIPKGRNSTNPWPTQHDLDKLARAVIDGLVKGKAMVDDRHVTSMTVCKLYAADGEEPGVTASVQEITVRI
jgi:Holliday junction resolvase RusA-like endonuclease